MITKVHIAKVARVTVLLFLLALVLRKVYLFVDWSPLSKREQMAHDTFAKAQSAVADYQKRTGQWPQSLNEVGDLSSFTFDGNLVRYDPTNVSFDLDYSVHEPDLLYTLTFGRFGSVSCGRGMRTSLLWATNSVIAEPPAGGDGKPAPQP